VLVEANPAKYSWVKIWADEVYLAVDALVQFSHLRVFKASFSEHFYGLRRLDKNGERITQRHLVLSFVILVFYPYVKKKLDKLLTDLRHEMASERIPSPNNGDQLLTSVPSHSFMKLYPIICFSIEASNLLLQLSYTVGKGDCYSLWCQLLGMRLVMDVRPKEGATKTVSHIGWSSWHIANWTARTIGTGLYIGAFFIQFLEYFYVREGSVTGKLMKNPKPPPPCNSLYSRVKINRLKDYCLLCNEKRRNDTVLSTSGFIFCYSCIRAFVARNQKCPATGLPSTQDHLIRLFPPEA